MPAIVMVCKQQAWPVTANFWVKNEGEATVNVDSVALHISADKVPRKPRIVRAPPRNRNLRSAPALPLVLNDNASYPILLAPGQYMVYRVQFVIRQDSLDVNEAISVTPVVVATGPQKLNTLTGNTVTVTAVLTNTGNTLLKIAAVAGASDQYGDEMTCTPAATAAVPPGGQFTCSLTITAHQGHLDYGSITRYLQFTGTPNVQDKSPSVLTEVVRYDAVATVNVLPTITQVTQTAFSDVGGEVKFSLGCENAGKLTMKVNTISVSITQDDLDRGYFKAFVILDVQAPWEYNPDGTDWREPRLAFSVATDQFAEVAADQVPLVVIRQTADPATLTRDTTTVTLTVNFKNHGNVRIADFESVVCQYNVTIPDQAAFEAGIAHQAELSGTYTNGDQVKNYTKAPETFTLAASPSPSMTLALSACGLASGPDSSPVKDVRVEVAATVMGQDISVSANDDNEIALVVNHSLDVGVVATPATLLPSSGLQSTVAVTLKNTGNVVLKWDAVDLRRVGPAGTYTLADCSNLNGLVPGGEVQCSFFVDNTLEQCNSWPTFSFEVSLTYTAAAISTGFARTGSSNTVTCRTCVVDECPSPLLVESELQNAFSWECDCKTKTITVNFNSPFRRGNCEDTPVSRIFLFTNATTDATKSLTPRCQQTGGVPKGGIARLPEVKPGQLVNVLLSDPTYKSKNALFGPSENPMLMSGPVANALFKSTKSNCNVGVGNGVTACGTYSGNYVVPAGASCGSCPKH
ncbi:hypothetical protein COO60DRAFT_1640236 [Scenedesmus sp. NREL 46B-D3]|nr:hypothetical protein COO60DRAFT_1640236 [Scenedesmus sp. NREL 46B-D3]